MSVDKKFPEWYIIIQYDCLTIIQTHKLEKGAESLDRDSTTKGYPTQKPR